MVDDIQYDMLPKIDLKLSPYFYREWNRNNLISLHQDTPRFYNVKLLKENPPLKYVDENSRVVYGKDSEGNVISDLNSFDELDKVVKGNDGEYVLYYTDVSYVLKSDKSGYTVTETEKVDEFKEFYRVLDCSKIIHTGFTPKENTVTVNETGNASTFVTRKNEENAGILLDDVSNYCYDEFKDVNDEAFNLELMYTSGSDGNIKIECKQLSPHMRIVGADGDTDTPIMIGGFIIYDLENKFMLGYALFNEAQSISNCLDIEDYDFNEWLNVDYTCKIEGDVVE